MAYRPGKGGEEPSSLWGVPGKRLSGSEGKTDSRGKRGQFFIRKSALRGSPPPGLGRKKVGKSRPWIGKKRGGCLGKKESRDVWGRIPFLSAAKSNQRRISSSTQMAGLRKGGAFGPYLWCESLPAKRGTGLTYQAIIRQAVPYYNWVRYAQKGVKRALY